MSDTTPEPAPKPRKHPTERALTILAEHHAAAVIIVANPAPDGEKVLRFMHGPRVYCEALVREAAALVDPDEGEDED